MHDVQHYINQQLGFGKWRSYDNVLNRLRCTRDDDYKEILPLGDNAPEGGQNTPIFACKFAQKDGSKHLLALANEDGRVAIHNTDTKERFGQQAHYNAIFDLAWMFQQMKIVTVSGDHTARLFDVSNCDMRNERIFSAHTRSVKTVATRQNDYSVFATGGRDGSIYVWDTRSNCTAGSFFNMCNVNVPDRTIQHSHNKVVCGNRPSTPTRSAKKKISETGNGVSGANSVTGLVFQDENTLISCGAGDGAIKVWDLRKNYRFYKREPVPKYIIPFAGNTTRNGFSNLTIDQYGLKLYANCLDNTIYCYNVSTCNPDPIMKYVGHENSTFYVKSTLSADGLYLLSGSSDHNAYVWNVKDSLPVVRLIGHTAEVTSVAWKQVGDLAVITCSDDFKHKIWRIGEEEVPDNWEVIGSGNAEKLKFTVLPSKLKRLLEMNETTPHSLKRRAKACETCNCVILNGDNCENCSGGGSTKRKNLEALFNENKRIQTEKGGPRRLFTQINENSTTEETKTEEISPNHAYSPTVNLPNFAIDGVAPHLNFSPQKRRDQDWLTKLRIEKSLIRGMQQLAAGPSPPKIPRVEFSPRSSGRSTATAAAASSAGSCKSPQSPLLKFFKVTNNSIKCDK